MLKLPRYCKGCDKQIVKKLKESGKLAAQGTLAHSYPFCPRSDTPLLYVASGSWFVRVEPVKEKLLKNNASTRWVPSFVSEKRFHNWLQDARDWCVSRSRFWGTPIPLWVSADMQEVVCIGSVAELEQYTNGRKITDIHKEIVDLVEIPSKQGKGVLTRIGDVFDCWFESGAMPYAQAHYPFENKEAFEKSFPADFIAEGLDQTRGWFYSLMVESTHLFNKPPFKNLICNGLVLASDGKKMSKRLKNYPDPTEVFNKHGADAVRMYMCNSPAVRAEPLKFLESGVSDVVKEIFLKWYNAFKFMVGEAGRLENTTNKNFKPDFSLLEKTQNQMDRWVLASCNHLLQFVQDEMESYRLYTVVPKLAGFWDELTNWYVRLNRDRMRGKVGSEEALTSLTVLYTVLLDVSILFAPVTPFVADFIYLKLAKALPVGHEKKAESVHFVMRPKYNPNLIDEKMEASVALMQQLIETGRVIRARRNCGVRKPLKSFAVIFDEGVSQETMDSVQALAEYIKLDLNVETLNFEKAGRRGRGP